MPVRSVAIAAAPSPAATRGDLGIGEGREPGAVADADRGEQPTAPGVGGELAVERAEQPWRFGLPVGEGLQEPRLRGDLASALTGLLVDEHRQDLVGGGGGREQRGERHMGLVLGLEREEMPSAPATRARLAVSTTASPMRRDTENRIARHDWPADPAPPRSPTSVDSARF